MVNKLLSMKLKIEKITNPTKNQRRTRVLGKGKHSTSGTRKLVGFMKILDIQLIWRYK